MTERRSSLSKQQFGRQAAHYVRSQVHASGETLDLLVEWAQPRPTDRVVDVATGVGFTAFAFAPHVASVTAFDTTAEMLLQGLRLSQQRGLSNVRFIQGVAERLPFPKNSYDIYTCRAAPHHFISIPEFLSEARRVVRPGGQVLVLDTGATGNPEVDQWLHQVELLRDPSHVRNYSSTEWLHFFAEAGLTVKQTANNRYFHLSFYDWVERTGAPPAVVRKLHALFAEAPVAVVRAFKIRPTGDDFKFAQPAVAVQAIKPFA